jgi:hypothetical protein
MREDDLLRIQHIGDVIDVLQTTAHHLYEPDELLTVIIRSFVLTNTQVAIDDADCYKPIVEALKILHLSESHVILYIKLVFYFI